jgi:hypothetical protein
VITPLNRPAQFLIKWTPRIICVTVGAYYGLGLAYEFGAMAIADKAAMYALKQFGGTLAIGIFMPTFQWYAAVSVRIVVGAACGIMYDLVERVALYVYSRMNQESPASV